MPSTARRRISALEDGKSGECTLCGIDASLPPRYVMGGDLLDEPDPDEPTESSEPCPRCGHRAVVVVDFDDPEPLPEHPLWSGEGRGG
jgi:hypothetical protein